MKRFQSLSLFAAIILSSFFVYSCMKDEVITEQATPLNALQAQTLTSTVENTVPITEKSEIKALSALKTTVTPANATTSQVSSAGPDDCSTPPKDGGGCKTTEITAADNITIDMPATALNPVHTVAILTFKMTICFNSDGTVATISYRDVRATNRDVFPEDLLLKHWLTLSSPALDEAIDQYEILAATRMEEMTTKQFLKNNPKVEIVESQYFRALCYTTCIYKVGEVMKTAKTTCGDKCCKRVRIFNQKPTYPIYRGYTYFETGATCQGNPQSPCEKAIKVTSKCNHECSNFDIDPFLDEF